MKKRTGKTTRIIDRCIQELFTKGVTYVYDGRGTSTQKEQTKIAFEIFVKRLKVEHPKVQTFRTYGEFDGIRCYKVIVLYVK